MLNRHLLAQEKRMGLWTKCMKCGNWKPMPTNPSASGQFPTGMMLTAETPPGAECTCESEEKEKEKEGA
jgi:hypothetical protein